MIDYRDWLEAMPALLRDVALREEVIDDLEDDEPPVIIAHQQANGNGRR